MTSSSTADGDDLPKPHSSWGMSRGDEIVPHCTIQSSLGGGKNFEVFVVWDEQMLIPVVLKVLRPDLVHRSDVLRGLRREASLLRRLSHPFVVRGFRSDVIGPRPYLIVERVPGPSLSALIRENGPLAFADVLNLGMAVASGLHYLHESGVVHLDVKASNIIMGRVPTLIDLSLAHDIDDAGKFTTRVGTAQYMAPEQCDPQNMGRPGPASDVWGLGATLFHAVNGRRPFRSGTKDETAPLPERYPQLVTAPRPLADDTPAPLAELIAACLSPRPADRPESSVAFNILRTLAGVSPAVPNADSGIGPSTGNEPADDTELRDRFSAALQSRKKHNRGPRRKH